MDPLTIALGLAQVAPSLMRYFGAGEKPAAIAEQVVALAQTVTGKTDGQQALAALQEDPALAHEFRLAVLKADADLEAAYLADRADARKRDVALAQAGYRNKRADVMVAIDAIGLVLSLAAMVGLGVIKAHYPDAITEGVFGALLAQFSTLASYFGLCLRDAHQFEFGSSRGSREKDAAMFGGR